MRGKVLPYMPAFQPYRGKPAVRNDREGRGNVGIIEARSAPRLYPTERLGVKFPGPTRPQQPSLSVELTAAIGGAADSRNV